jgi:putative effector of murein hydrolase LrgA (UPF0299 family)
MILPLAILLSCQLAGEVFARGLGLPVPGPVVGMALLFAGLVAVPPLGAMLRPVATGLLAHLSLLFVPAGVGVVGHLDRLGAHALGLGAALVGSTVLAIVAGAVVFRLVARMTGAGEGAE